MTAAERMYSRLLSQFRNKPNIKAFLDAIGSELDELDTVREHLRTDIYPTTATGAQLDLCGEVADITRVVANVIAMDYFGFPSHGDNTFGEAPFRRMIDSYLGSATLDDRYYRTILLAKIAKNNTDCSRLSTLSSLKQSFDLATMQAVNAGNAKIRVGIGRLVSDNEGRIIAELNIIIRAAGVGIIYIYSYNGDETFGFSREGENYGNFLGFGEGVFARIIQDEGGIVL